MKSNASKAGHASPAKTTHGLHLNARGPFFALPIKMDPARSMNTSPQPSSSQQRRTLAMASTAHALHDGYTDMIYVLLPLWQSEFALSYVLLGGLRGLYSAAMAGLQVWAAQLAQRWGAVKVLTFGTLLAAIGYGWAGFSAGLVGLCAALVLSGAGSSTQHPLASAAVARAYGHQARGPLGVYNFGGDVGKASGRRRAVFPRRCAIGERTRLARPARRAGDRACACHRAASQSPGASGARSRRAR